jgi:uncharacterized protein YjiK
MVTAQQPDAPVLRLQDMRKIAERTQGFSEPSGLALSADGTGYWSVSDDSAAIYWLAPDGRLVPGLALAARVSDLEGVAEDKARNRLLAVSEDRAEIVAIGLEDGLLSRHPIVRMAGFDRISALFGAVGSNNGLEGITVDTTADEIVVVKENGPRLLIRISADLSRILGVTALTGARGFVCDGADDVTLDVSDITHDAARKSFWILSDAGACVFLFDPATGQAAGTALPGSVNHPDRRLKNAEGIALNSDGSAMRIVTDDGKESQLAIFAIDTPAATGDASAEP